MPKTVFEKDIFWSWIVHRIFFAESQSFFSKGELSAEKCWWRKSKILWVWENGKFGWDKQTSSCLRLPSCSQQFLCVQCLMQRVSQQCNNLKAQEQCSGKHSSKGWNRRYPEDQIKLLHVLRLFLSGMHESSNQNKVPFNIQSWKKGE